MWGHKQPGYPNLQGNQGYNPHPQQQGYYGHQQAPASYGKTSERELYQIFRSWDKNGDGTIDFYELAEILKNMGEDNSPDTVKAIMDAYDKDGNGVIDFYEFEDLFNYIQNMHNEFNRGASGNYISFQQAENVLARGLPGKIAAPAALYSIWRIYDPKGTGKMNWKHFLLLAIALKALQNDEPHYKKKKPGLFTRIMDKVENVISGTGPQSGYGYGPGYGSGYSSGYSSGSYNPGYY